MYSHFYWVDMGKRYGEIFEGILFMCKCHSSNIYNKYCNF